MKGADGFFIRRRSLGQMGEQGAAFAPAVAKLLADQCATSDEALCHVGRGFVRKCDVLDAAVDALAQMGDQGAAGLRKALESIPSERKALAGVRKEVLAKLEAMGAAA